MEVMKNRDLGVEYELIGMYYEVSSKRLLNTPKESKAYKWDDFSLKDSKGRPADDNDYSSLYGKMENETGNGDNPFLQEDA